VFTTDLSPAFPVLRALADAMETYDVLIPGHTPAPDAAERGLYVDHVNF
jgi:hypothetical protein